MIRPKELDILEKYWGYEHFRWNQLEAISALLKWKNIVYIAKTGDWKSICYQIPAIMWKGLTIIVSPLKSLMKDQVESLERLWVSAIFLNSDLEEDEYKERFKGLMNWEYKMLYVSPEKLSNENFIEYLKEVPNWIDYFIIDEFDTVDEYWSSWFRPEYLQLWSLKNQLEENQDRKIVTWIFTATATKKVEELVTEMMWIEDDYKLFRWLLIWENLKYEIHSYEKKEDKDKNLYWYIEQIDKNLKKDWGSGIIFCTTTKDVDNIYKLLKDKFKIARYHWQMNSKFKNSSFNKFMSWEVNLIVCTNAFWRGVDKKDIRYILHYWIPWNISSYLQEIWRGGRDWKDYSAITLYSWQDIWRRKFLSFWKSEQISELNNLLEFLENQDECRTKELHKYFGLESDNKCNQCDICRTDTLIELKSNLKDFKVKKIPRKKIKRRKVTKKSTSSKKKVKK